MRKLRLSPVSVAATWRIVQAAAASIVLASVLMAVEQPYPDICAPCARGEVNWWLCLVAGCLW